MGREFRKPGSVLRITSAFVFAPLASVAGLGLYGLIVSVFSKEDPLLVWALVLVGLLLFAVPPTLFFALPLFLSLKRQPLLRECVQVGSILGGVPYGLFASLVAISDPSALLHCIGAVALAFSLGALGGATFWFVAYGGRAAR